MNRISQRYRKMKLDRIFKKNPGQGVIHDLGNGDRAFLWPDEISYKIYTTHNFEGKNRALWERSIQTGMTVFDVGANWGIYTLAASRLVGKNGSVYSFEPNDREREKLLRNLDLMDEQRKQTVTVSNEAIGNYTGTTSFHIPVDYKGAYGSIRKPDIEENCVEVTVPLTTLDAFISNNGIEAFDAMKVDVEGNELNVLDGAKASLQKFQPLVFMEVSDRRTKAYEYKASRLCEILLEMGYELYIPGDVDDQGNPSAIAYTPTDYISYVDMFAIPKNLQGDWLQERGIIVRS